MWWDEPSEEPVADHRGVTTYLPGLRHLGISAGMLVLLALATYLIPGLDDWRPWISGEPVPMSRIASIFTGDKGVDGSAGVAAPSSNETALTAEAAKDSVAKELGSALAANLGAEAGVEQVAVHEGPAVEISSDELKGVVREIEDPSGKAMDVFYGALLATARAGDGAVTRIAHWGDSTIAADNVTGTLRRRFQRRFGDAGHGFILPGRSTMPYRHEDVVAKESGPWKFANIIRGERDDGLYGLGGVLFWSKKGGKLGFATNAKEGGIGREIERFDVYFNRHPGGGKLTWSTDLGERQTIDTKGDLADDFMKIDLPKGSHSLDLEVLGDGDVRLYGVVMENAGPGVVYDSLGIVGARASRLLNADAAHFAGQVRKREPNLMILAFGGNEADDRKMGMARYKETLTKAIKLVRAGRPEASCLLMAPLDQGEVGPRGKVRTMPMIPKIVQAQREVAVAEGCAFFDTFTAMGGNGSMKRWYDARPRLGWGDFRHATPAGYEVIGNVFYKALLKGFSDYLNKNGLNGEPVSPQKS